MVTLAPIPLKKPFIPYSFRIIVIVLYMSLYFKCVFSILSPILLSEVFAEANVLETQGFSLAFAF
jgi:hypothetical protein